MATTKKANASAAKVNKGASGTPNKTVTATAETNAPQAEAAVEAPVTNCGDPEYSIRDFCECAGTLFDGKYSQDIILVALKLAGKEEYTKAEAEAAIEAFANKEV